MEIRREISLYFHAMIQQQEKAPASAGDGKMEIVIGVGRKIEIE